MNRLNQKIMIGVLAAGLIGVSSVYAKPKDQPLKPVTADDIVEKMKVQLQLTDSQTLEVKSIIENYLGQEKQLKLEEKKQLSKVLTGQQLFTWDFLQKEKTKDKKKHAAF